MQESQKNAAEWLAQERAALDRWGRGDPSGYLEISHPEVSYFDPFEEKRIDGLDHLREYYAPLKGTIRVDRDDIVEPRVQTIGDVAILTFKYYSQTGNDVLRWNCTEVYARQSDRWAIVHTHWSLNARNTEPW